METILKESEDLHRLQHFEHTVFCSRNVEAMFKTTRDMFKTRDMLKHKRIISICREDTCLSSLILITCKYIKPYIRILR